MPRVRKLTVGQVDRVLAVHAARSKLLEALKALPTLEALALELGLSVSTLKQITSGRTYRGAGSTGNSLAG